MANENNLAGLRCPKCGSYGPFGIAITAWAVSVTDDGFTDVEDVEWDRDSIIRCETCNEVATVADFNEALYGKGGCGDSEDNPDFPRADWREEVSSGNTVLGYAEWVAHKDEEFNYALYGGLDPSFPPKDRAASDKHEGEQ